MKIIDLKNATQTDQSEARDILIQLHEHLDAVVGNPAAIHTLRESLYKIKRYVDAFDDNFDVIDDARSDYDAAMISIPLIAKFMEQTKDLCDRLKDICDNISAAPSAYAFIMSLLDSDPHYFKGDLIITDPCYLITDIEGWEKSQQGRCLDQIGFHDFMVRDLIYDDWVCTAYTDTDIILGNFSSDSRALCVIPFDEFNTYRFPGMKLFENDLALLIKNFEGTVSFKIDEIPFDCDGTICHSYELHVVGHGIDFLTGVPLNFTTEQTGF